jgi:hypothetical protein
MADFLNLVDVERIYRHVLAIEGEKYPLDSLEKLNECGDYILKKFRDYGLTATEQEFQVDGFDASFRNIEGSLGDGLGPELLIVSHYDTVRKSPGANDNASAVAVMLETARLLASEGDHGNLRFIGFTLEEMNPARELSIRKLGKQYGIIDEQGRYTTWQTAKIMKNYSYQITKYSTSGKPLNEVFNEVTGRLEPELTASQVKYLRELEKLSSGITASSSRGRTGPTGSSVWVEKAVRNGSEIMGVLCLETIGYTSPLKNSQQFPPDMDPGMFQVFGTDKNLTTGDFLAIVGDGNSAQLAEAFCRQCERDDIKLPYACLQADFSYEQAANLMPDILRSDHAPFWKADIPGLLLTDSANFRYLYYHTAADTIDKLDFDFLEKVCKATASTAIEITTQQEACK